MGRYVVLEIPEEDFDFITGFDPDRDQTVTRREMVDVLADIADIVADGYTGEEFDRDED